jgi:hypothetical protein
MKKFLLLSALAMLGTSAFAEGDNVITKYDYNTIREINLYPTNFSGANISANLWTASNGSDYWSADNGLCVLSGNLGKDMVEPGLSLVDLGGEVGKVLCINGYNSNFNDYVKTKYDVELNAPKMDSSKKLLPNADAFWQFNWFADPDNTPLSDATAKSTPSDCYVHVKMVFNVFSNSFTTDLVPKAVYVMDNGNNMIPDGDNGASNIGVSTQSFIQYSDDNEPVKENDAYVWDPTKWMVYEFDTWCPKGSAPIYIKAEFGNGANTVGTRTVLVKSVEFTKMEGTPTSLKNHSQTFETLKAFDYTSTGGTTAVSDLAVEDSEAPVEVYNLSGVRVNSDNLPAGLYIRRQGNKATKVVVK